MHLDHHEISQEIGLAFMRHQELIAAAQQQRLLTQAEAGQAAGRRAAPAWRRRLGKQLVTWGEALQASDRPPYSAAGRPALTNLGYSRPAAHRQSQ